MTSQLPPDLPEHDNALRTGVRLGEFEIVDVIGVGGFGIVYRAFDHDLEREVAIKEYMPGQFAGRDATGAVTVRARTHAETFGIGLRSFVNEARLLARFDHPALLKVYRYWEAHGTAYMAMPFYDGSTLSQVVRGLPGPPSQAWLMGVIEPLLGALELLHSQQIYHRDISPDNILLLDDGHPVLLDFGAARRVIGDRTQTLTAILKPNYAPIEQYAEIPGLKQGPWTDLYALGAVVYACLTGKPPSPAATRAVMDDLVPLEQLGQQLQQHHNLHFDASFLAAWQATLAVKPADRVQNIVQLRALLAGGVDPANDPERTLIKAPAPAAASPVMDDGDPERTVIRARPKLPPRSPEAVTGAAPPGAAVTGAGVTAGVSPRATAERPVTAPKPPTQAPAAPPRTTAPPPPSAPARSGGSRLVAALVAGLVLAGAGGYWLLHRGAEPVSPAASTDQGASAVMAAASPPAEVPSAPPPALAAASAASDVAAAPVPLAPVSIAEAVRPSPPVDLKPVPQPASQVRKPSVRPPGKAEEGRAATSAQSSPEASNSPSSPVAPSSGPASAPPPAPVGPATATAACSDEKLTAFNDSCMRKACAVARYKAEPDCFRYLSTEDQEDQCLNNPKYKNVPSCARYRPPPSR
ncbi:MAG: hypothetical protein RLY71_2060 [Pseudomonadota bacterium]|jgi:serine/threonine protein kinase